jgi:formate-dependent nitrite reductase membrane component NrfD
MGNALVISYAFFSGLGAGTFFVNAILSLFSPVAAVSKTTHRLIYTGEKHIRFIGPGFISCVIAQCVSIACFGFGVGQVDTISVFQTEATLFAMGIGACALVVLLLCGIFLAIVWMGIVKPRALFIHMATIVGLFTSVSVIVCTGLLLQGNTDVHFWNSAWVSILFTLSSYSMGIALIFVVAHISRSHVAFGSVLGHLMSINVVLIVIELLALGIFIVMSGSIAETKETTDALVFGSYVLLFWLGLVFAGLLLPAILSILFQWSSSNKAKMIPSYLIMFGGLCLRACIILVVY